MPKLTKQQLSAYGTKIMTEAKRIRKSSPSKKWTQCVKEAAKTLKK